MMVASLSAGISMKGGGAASMPSRTGQRAVQLPPRRRLRCLLADVDGVQPAIPAGTLRALADALGVERGAMNDVERGRAGIAVVRDLVRDCEIPTLSRPRRRRGPPGPR